MSAQVTACPCIYYSVPAQVTACPCIYYSVPVVNRRARDNNAPMQSAMDPYWPEGEPVAFQCPCCLHCVKALQSTQPTCNHYEPCSGVGPLITMGCHGQLLTGPYFPAAWLQVCADCSHGKDASAWEQFSDPVNGKCQTSPCVYCCPRSAILPEWRLLPEEKHPDFRYNGSTGYIIIYAVV